MNFVQNATLLGVCIYAYCFVDELVSPLDMLIVLFVKKPTLYIDKSRLLSNILMETVSFDVNFIISQD